MRFTIAVLIFAAAMIFTLPALGQGSLASTGGLSASGQATGHSDVHMLNVPPTQFFLVDGQNPEGAPASQNYLDWNAAVALGKAQYVANHEPETLGAIARRYRKPHAVFAAGKWVCPQGFQPVASEEEQRAGEADFVHCQR